MEGNILGGLQKVYTHKLQALGSWEFFFLYFLDLFESNLEEVTRLSFSFLSRLYSGKFGTLRFHSAAKHGDQNASARFERRDK